MNKDLTTHRSAKHSLLIVDDNEAHLQLMSIAVSSLATHHQFVLHKTAHFASAKEIILANADSLKVCCLDLYLNDGHSGLELLPLLAPDTCSIVVSSSTEPVDREKSLHAGADFFLSKEADSTPFHDTLQQLVMAQLLQTN